MLGTIVLALFLGLVTAVIGMTFDKTPDNRYAWGAGGLVALLVLMTRLFGTGL